MGRATRRTPFRFNLPRGKNSAKAKRRRHQLPPDQIDALAKSDEVKQCMPPSFYTAKPLGDFKFGFRKSDPPELELDGNRIVNLRILATEIAELCLHCATCPHALLVAKKGQAPMKLLGEGRRYGFASFLHARCTGCYKRFTFGTSPRITCTKGDRFDINVRAVWGEMASGGGAAKLNEVCGTMGLPGITNKSFSAIEEEIGSWWEKAMQEELQKNGNQERELAISRGEFHEGVPAVTVIVDGGWSKRTHRHTYNALGGVAVVIGAATQKLLYIGVRNKYCSVCIDSQTKGKKSPPHRCFKNWNNSSQSMEADIILEAFNCSEEMHGLRFMKFVGDGDSSVYATLLKDGPHWCRDVQKIECANHACKCLRSNLEKVTSDHPEMKGRNGLSQQKRVHLVSFVRCAIRKRSQQTNKGEAAVQLQKDINTSLWHVFGHHNKCSSFICTAGPLPSHQHDPRPTVAHDDDDDDDDDCDDLDSILAKQATFWTAGSTVREQEAATSYITKQVAIPPRVLAEVPKLLNRLAKKSSTLLANTTTNLCECWMSIRAKFDGGKQVMRCRRGSWAARCYGAGLRSSLGAMWAPQVWNRITNTRPSSPFIDVYRTRSNVLLKSKASKARVEVKRRARKRKHERQSQSNTKFAKMSYGTDSVQVDSDTTRESLEEKCALYYSRNVEVSTEAAKIIERTSREQSYSGVWHTERKHRLTSSNFKSVISRKPKTPTVPLTKRLLYSAFQGNQYTEYGLHQEEETIASYKQLKASDGISIDVQASGLIIHPSHPFLACSPDGQVIETVTGDRGLVEVKNLLFKKNIGLRQAAKSVKSFCLQLDGDDLHLKRNHAYYLQCQGQLAIAGMPWVDFVVRSTNPDEIHVERIYKDDTLWKQNMLPKLQKFYFECLLPELTLPRKGKVPGIREAMSGLNSNLYIPVVDEEPLPSTSSAALNPTTTRASTRRMSKKKKPQRNPRFLGKNIRHQWKDEDTDELVWYIGRVEALVTGRDGTSNAVYDIKYEGESDSFEVDHLVEDFLEGSVEILFNSAAQAKHWERIRMVYG